MIIEKLIKHLKKSYILTEHIAYDIWTEDDVIEQAEEMNVKLTDDEVIRVLDLINTSKDASVGINWGVIESCINDLIIEKNKSKNIIIYGGTKKQIEQQLDCNHEWSDPCVDFKSRYVKCKKCFCIQRDMSEN